MSRRATAQGALAVGALGVVFGDIGTSPLYTVQTVFNPSDPHPIAVSEESIFGVVSLIFWSVTLIVTITYVSLVMRADNDGEGGIMALITLIRRRGAPSGRRTAMMLTVLGVFGASLFFGDSVITPAISVLSAVEGVKVAAPSLAGLVVPITAAIIVSLFLVQRTSAALAYAYGMAVTGTITITTLLFLYVARSQWHTPLWILLPGGGALLAVDLLFFAANLTKLVHGAWLPLLIAIVAFTVLTTWQKGRELVTQQRQRDEGPLRAFIDQLHAMKPPLQRVPSTAVFLNRGKATAPLALRANVEHNQVLHEHTLILAVETVPVPHVPAAERLTIDDLGYKDDRIIHVTARFGYMDPANIPGLLPLIAKANIESPLDDDRLSYFLSRIELHPGNAPGMSRWRKRLFLATSRITADAAEYFQLPRDRTVVMGSRIEL